jgi:hypothetical protein
LEVSAQGCAGGLKGEGGVHSYFVGRMATVVQTSINNVKYGAQRPNPAACIGERAMDPGALRVPRGWYGAPQQNRK